MKVKKNDTVLILAGKDKGKTGKVLVTFPKADRVTVDGVNVQKKHKKARKAQEQSGIINQSGPIDVSNVQVICPSCNKATRIEVKEIDGKNVRVCKKCGAVIATVATKAADKTATKPAAKKATAKKTDDKTAEKPAKKAPAKKTAAKKAEVSAEK